MDIENTYQKDDQGEIKIDDHGNPREDWVWLPKSQVQRDGDNVFTMPEWLAKDKGLI